MTDASSRPRNTDLFAAGNLILFTAWLAIAAEGERRGYRMVGSVPEFAIYATGIVAVIAIAWFFLRARPCGAGLLLLVEAGLLAHFAGAFVPIDGGRLYEVTILGLRFDNYVHILNAFGGAALIDHFLAAPEARTRTRPLIIVGLVLGAGSVIEIVEYLAFLSVPDAGVGGYENNMQDLIANLAGALAFVAVASAFRRTPGG